MLSLQQPMQDETTAQFLTIRGQTFAGRPGVKDF